MVFETMLLAALTIPTDDGQHAYDVALEYCQDKGGLAQYTVKPDTVEFSCGNDLEAVITITR